MKKLIVLGAALSLLVGGCALHDRGHGMHGTNYSANPTVVVSERPGADGNPSFSVWPRTLVFAAGQRNVEIVWKLQLPKDSKLSFSGPRGIYIEGEIKETVEKLPRDGDSKSRQAANLAESTYLDRSPQDQILRCMVRDGGREFSCLNVHSRPGRFKYSVRLTDGTSDYRIDPDVDNW